MASATSPSANHASGQADIKERALELAATAREQVSGGTRGLKEYIIKEPTRALGIALVLGVVIGWLIKRR